ncbi:protein DOG1-like 4 [Gastrolobium bilobum]|uniref:protein DOG1-like 4 n=1 Tax=Gastrolobium bilobum TaxID=150636 RepID=UPI002AB0651E|nr:protein DOG1-like 4 [Gastrolobium bilobum]
MKNPVVESFSEFYEKWVWKLEEILNQLLEVLSKKKTEIQVINEQELQKLVSRVTSHLKEYYTVKWASAHEDVLVFFSPTWLSPLENAYLWVTGWKPSTAFRLLESLKKAEKEGGKAFEMTEEQERKIEELRMKIRMEEEKVEREMERQQVAMADRKMVEMAKISSRGRNNGDVVASSSQVALKGVFGGLEKVMKASDCVRLKTLKGVLDLLTPMQCVQFLAANIAMHLRLRQWGKNRDVAVNEENIIMGKTSILLKDIS